MSYLFEILPSLLSGASMTFAGFCTGLDFFYSLGRFDCLCLASPLEAPPSSD